MKLDVQNFASDFISDMPLMLKGEKLSLILKGKVSDSSSQNTSGKIQLNAVNLIGSYDDEIPFMGDKIRQLCY